ncbi:MAG: HAMP domain-containing histidine kinase [Nitrospirae bacterium]|nr:HAMP domain-containing histidine kinase [Nitrospirota bacterium]MCL5238830.1 HAMP domain-containing histidine kinase [Nitrospirota bacterium]
MSITEIFAKQSKPLLTALGFVLVILIGGINYLTGPLFSSLVFYLVPVIFVTWFVGRSAGILISVASALMWVFVDMTAKPSYPHIIIPVWNLAEKLGIFLIVVYILLRLAEERELSRKLERERMYMLSMFAHDMKNPVVTAGGFLLRLLSGKAGPLTGKQLDYLALISNELAVLERFITDFLEFSRFESKEYKPVPLPFDTATAIKRHVEAAKMEADRKDIKLFFESPGDTAAVVNADAVQIDRVITNLLDNAIKYTGQGGAVTVRLLNRERDVLVQITDTGIGIPEDHIPNIFDAFYRVTRDSKGSGLGLAIVKIIVEANGGRIWVESIHGKGSTFSFTLPKRRKD